jgi:hypothetical protein
MTGTLTINNIDTTGILNIGQNASSINIGSGSNNDFKTINIGSPNDTINILGNTYYVQTTNNQIKNKIIIINEG